MRSHRELRRTGGFIARFFTDTLIRQVKDPRSLQGRRIKTITARLKLVCLALASGCKGLRDAEALSERMATDVRRIVGILERIADTSMRDLLVAFDPNELCKLLWVTGYDAIRRKAIRVNELFPWGVASLDGKYPTVRDVGDNENQAVSKFLQVHHDKETGEGLFGVVRVITCVLISAASRPIISATPVPGNTNEVGHFTKALGDLVRVYGRHIRVILYDAGAASLKNATAVVRAGKDYVFQIADPGWVMYQTVELLLKDVKPAHRTEETSGRRRVVRVLSMLPVSKTKKNLTMWPSAKTIIKVYSETYVDGVLDSSRTRYFVTSLEESALEPEKWLKLIVARWGVEIAHQILDCALLEDDRPWITSDANGTLSVMLLRRLVYTILALYKSVTMRSEENRLMTWNELMSQIKDTLEWAQGKVLDGLRPRTFAVPPALA